MTISFPPLEDDTLEARLEAAAAYLKDEAAAGSAEIGGLEAADFEAWAPGSAAPDLYMLWSADALREGAAQIPFWYGGEPYYGQGDKVQTALAQYGLAPAIEAPEGRAQIARDEAPTSSSLISLCRAFDRLREQGYWAYPCHRMMQSYGWEDARERDQADEAVFWTYQSHEGSFTPRGDLKSALFIFWSGDVDTIAAALEAEGLRIDAPSSDRQAFRALPPETD